MNTSAQLINDIEETENLLLSNPSTSSSSPPNHEYPQQQIDKHRHQFEQWIQTKYIDNNKTTYVMRKAEYDQIKDVLSGVRTIKDANQRHKFNKKLYSLDVDKRVCQRKETIIDKKNKKKKIEIKKVIFLEEFFDVLYDAHCIKRMHQGVTKTFEYIQEIYTGMPKVVVSKFRKFCYICDLNKKQISQPRITPIISSAIFERVQIDLVDMRNQPDGEYNWIGHMEDHNGQYHVIWPQKKKEG